MLLGEVLSKQLELAGKKQKMPTFREAVTFPKERKKRKRGEKRRKKEKRKGKGASHVVPRHMCM